MSGTGGAGILLAIQIFKFFSSVIPTAFLWVIELIHQEKFGTAAVWTDRKHNMLYIIMGHNDIPYENDNEELSTLDNPVQNRIVMAGGWLATGENGNG